MIIAIAEAYNGKHSIYKKELDKLGAKTFLFNIDDADWLNNFLRKKKDLVLWHADTKDENCRVILDRIYFIEKILNIPIFPDLNQYFAYNDKIKQDDIFNFLKVSRPRTFITYEKKKAQIFAKGAEYPFVLKNIYGAGGFGISIVKNVKQAFEAADKIFSTGFMGIKNYFYAQEYIASDRDLRIITIGNKCACAYWRINKANWIHNIEQGGKADFTKIPRKAIKECERVSQKMGYHWMAYDIIMDKEDKPKFIEMSCNFATKGPEQYGINVRKMMMEYMIRHFDK